MTPDERMPVERRSSCFEQVSWVADLHPDDVEKQGTGHAVLAPVSGKTCGALGVYQLPTGLQSAQDAIVRALRSKDRRALWLGVSAVLAVIDDHAYGGAVEDLAEP